MTMALRRIAAHRRGQSPVTGHGVAIAPMRRKHLRSVVAIEQQVFPTPWSLSLYLSELTMGSNRAYFVALAGNEVVGYAGLMLAVGEGHVTTIGVSPRWQRRGIGRRLMIELAETARNNGAEDLTLEVRVTNTGAQALYHEFGFAPAGIRKNYYAEVHEDAIVMWAHDIQSEEYKRRLEIISGEADELGRDDGAESEQPTETGPSQHGAGAGS
ncbi:MAG: ribosomal protein S18-alanine N-acetyltransferase [Acidimicrobiales bacterium]